MRREADNENWGGPRPGSGRPLKPLTPIAAKEKAAELVKRAVKVLDSAAVKDGYGVQLMSIADSLEENINSERVNKLKEIIEASEYLTAQTEYNGMYTRVDGSLLNGNFSITTGVQGMPPTEYQEVSGIDATTKVIEEKGLLDEDWRPVGEDE